MQKKVYNEIIYYEPETLKDIFALNYPITVCTEYNGYYYIQLDEGGEYNNDIYEVNKKTGKIDSRKLDFIGYKIDIEPKAIPVDPETLRRAS